MHPPHSLETDFPEGETSPGLLLWQVTNAWQGKLRRALGPFDLTHVQFVLLATLTWLQGDKPVTQSHLASLARTDPMMTSQVLRTLENKGLILRRPHPSDSRAKSLTVTAAGKELANRATAVVEQTDREFFGELGDKAPAFTSMMRVLSHAEPLNSLKAT